MKIPIIVAIVGIVIGLGIFSIFTMESSVPQSSMPETTEIPIQEEIQEYDETITVGTIHRDAVKMTKRYQPLADYLAEKLSTEDKIYKGIVHIDASEEDMINHKHVDVFFDSPLIGIKVANQIDMEPILLSWKEGVRDYHSVFIVPIGSDIEISNLHGKTIVFEDEESTSGYLLPSIHLENLGYDLEENNIKSVFSLDDENTPIWVLEGKGDLGVVSNLDFEDTPKNVKDKLKIIEETNSIPRQLIIVKSELESKTEIKNILLEMDDSEVGKRILDKISHTSQVSEIEEKDLGEIIKLLEMIN